MAGLALGIRRRDGYDYCASGGVILRDIIAVDALADTGEITVTTKVCTLSAPQRAAHPWVQGNHFVKKSFLRSRVRVRQKFAGRRW